MLILSLKWYEYEDLVRALVRSWGFRVEYQPVVKYNKEIDVTDKVNFSINICSHPQRKMIIRQQDELKTVENKFHKRLLVQSSKENSG